MDTGLCSLCRHRRWVANRRGSRFLLCELAALDPRYARYPQLPVLRCAGFAPRADRESEGEPK